MRSFIFYTTFAAFYFALPVDAASPSYCTDNNHSLQRRIDLTRTAGLSPWDIFRYSNDGLHLGNGDTLFRLPGISENRIITSTTAVAENSRIANRLGKPRFVVRAESDSFASLGVGFINLDDAAKDDYAVPPTVENLNTRQMEKLIVPLEYKTYDKDSLHVAEMPTSSSAKSQYRVIAGNKFMDVTINFDTQGQPKSVRYGPELRVCKNEDFTPLQIKDISEDGSEILTDAVVIQKMSADGTCVESERVHLPVRVRYPSLAFAKSIPGKKTNILFTGSFKKPLTFFFESAALSRITRIRNGYAAAFYYDRSTKKTSLISAPPKMGRIDGDHAAELADGTIIYREWQLDTTYQPPGPSLLRTSIVFVPPNNYKNNLVSRYEDALAQRSPLSAYLTSSEDDGFVTYLNILAKMGTAWVSICKPDILNQATESDFVGKMAAMNQGKCLEMLNDRRAMRKLTAIDGNILYTKEFLTLVCNSL